MQCTEFIVERAKVYNIEMPLANGRNLYFD